VVELRLQEDLARFVPNAQHVTATERAHTIHEDQPELVIDAIRQAAAAERGPSTRAAPVASSAP
jgi:pimeloyl-ACP methyl ester carboxylesterase